MRFAHFFMIIEQVYIRKDADVIDEQIARKAPLWQALQEYQKLNRTSFHTPGHKGKDFFPKNPWQNDLTELPETDALYEAEGVILASEKELARLYHADRSLISAGGCTLAIQAMIRLACHGGKLLCSRILHRSAVNTMALLGIEPLWILPKNQSGCSGRIEPEQVLEMLNKHDDIDAVYITSPDYYGALSDIAGISAVCQKFNIPLLVDNAHGSHLAFLHENLHPLHLGATMTACSMHKTLPVLTGGAALNIHGKKYTENAKTAMALFGSTSPSYPIMCSIDLCVQWLLNGGAEKYAALESTIAKIKSTTATKGIIQPLGLCDPLRISLNTASVGMSGTESGAYFRERGLEPEMFDRENVVFICTPFNTNTELERLHKAILDLPTKTSVFSEQNFAFELPERVMTIREALLSPKKNIPLEQAVGEIAADIVCPCPPGIPLVIPGERITATCVGRLKTFTETITIYSSLR